MQEQTHEELVRDVLCDQCLGRGRVELVTRKWVFETRCEACAGSGRRVTDAFHNTRTYKFPLFPHGAVLIGLLVAAAALAVWI